MATNFLVDHSKSFQTEGLLQTTLSWVQCDSPGHTVAGWRPFGEIQFLMNGAFLTATTLGLPQAPSYLTSVPFPTCSLPCSILALAAPGQALAAPD